jgi:hypothetical protein
VRVVSARTNDDGDFDRLFVFDFRVLRRRRSFDDVRFTPRLFGIS